MNRHVLANHAVAAEVMSQEAALQAGNSESIIRKHYLDLKTT